MLFIGIQIISGLMFGVEFVWNDKAMVIDVGIVRLIFQFDTGEEEQ